MEEIPPLPSWPSEEEDTRVRPDTQSDEFPREYISGTNDNRTDGDPVSFRCNATDSDTAVSEYYSSLRMTCDLLILLLVEKLRVRNGVGGISERSITPSVPARGPSSSSTTTNTSESDVSSSFSSLSSPSSFYLESGDTSAESDWSSSSADEGETLLGSEAESSMVTHREYVHRRRRRRRRRTRTFLDPEMEFFDLPVPKRPLPRHVFAKLPVIRVDDAFRAKNGICTVCLEEFVGEEEAKMLSCGHVYHVNCIETWFREQDACPICRITVS